MGVTSIYHWEIAEVVFALAVGTVFTDQPDLFDRKMVLANLSDALR